MEMPDLVTRRQTVLAKIATRELTSHERSD